MTPLTPGAAPERVTLDGRYCRIEPLSETHSEALYESIETGIIARYHYLPVDAPADAEAHHQWVISAESRADRLYFAVVDKATGRCGGRHALMRIRREDRSIEFGGLLWGDGVAKTRLATEAFFLSATYVFDTLDYRRFEWKCDDRNDASKRAAIRFGFTFEGVFRQDMIIKGRNRDTAWYSILDHEWPALKEKFESWLDPSNFDEAGQEKSSLTTPRLPV